MPARELCGGAQAGPGGVLLGLLPRLATLCPLMATLPGPLPRSYDWVDADTIVAAIVPPGLGPPPRKPLTPLGPKIEVCRAFGHKARGRALDTVWHGNLHSPGARPRLRRQAGKRESSWVGHVACS